MFWYLFLFIYFNLSNFFFVFRALARIGNAYTKKEELDKAILFYQKSLSEHRDQNIVRKVNDLQKAQKEKERLAYINPEISLQEKDKGNDCFKKGTSIISSVTPLVAKPLKVWSV